MSVYRVKNRGWRYSFHYNKKRYTKGTFKTSRLARQAEYIKRIELEKKSNDKEFESVFDNLLSYRLEFLKRNQQVK